MKLQQIIIRPDDAHPVLVQHTNNAGRTEATLVDVDALASDEQTAVHVVVDLCAKAMPAEVETPVLSEVEQEIAELEYKLEHLRKSLGKVSNENKPAAP
jgi:hypothetical protein